MKKRKPTLTKATSLSEEVTALLNKQIAMESLASQQYLASASWCHKEGYEGAANFMYNHSEEERMHMMKLVNYVNDSGGHALAPDMTDIRNDFESLHELFDYALEKELKVSESINEIVGECFERRDFTTFQFMQWYVEEQREEEQVCRRILELFDLIGTEGQGLWLIDQEIAKMDEGEEGGLAPEGEA